MKHTCNGLLAIERIYTCQPFGQLVKLIPSTWEFFVSGKQRQLSEILNAGLLAEVTYS